MRGFDLPSVFIIAFAIIVIGALIKCQSDWSDECTTKGGVPYCGYKSSCVCLAPGTVIP